jgi:predicted ABC-type ATPase
MAKEKPHLIVIAGPNGAGKSTTAPALLKGTLEVTAFVNNKKGTGTFSEGQRAGDCDCGGEKMKNHQAVCEQVKNRLDKARRV